MAEEARQPDGLSALLTHALALLSADLLADHTGQRTQVGLLDVAMITGRGFPPHDIKLHRIIDVRALGQDPQAEAWEVLPAFDGLALFLIFLVKNWLLSSDTLGV